MDKAMVLDGLLAAIIQDGIPSRNFKEHANITFMRIQEGIKPSLIILSLGSKELKTLFLVSTKKGRKLELRNLSLHDMPKHKGTWKV